MLRWWFWFAVVSSVLKLHQQCWALTHDISQAPPPHTPKQLHKGFWMIFDKSGESLATPHKHEFSLPSHNPICAWKKTTVLVPTIIYKSFEERSCCSLLVTASGWCPEGILDFCSRLTGCREPPGVAVYIDEDAAVPDLWRDEHGKTPDSHHFIPTLSNNHSTLWLYGYGKPIWKAAAFVRIAPGSFLRSEPEMSL